MKVTQLCATLCDPMDCSPPGSSVHGISQSRILEWAAISFSRDLPDPGMKTRSPVLEADSLPSEPPRKFPKSRRGVNWWHYSPCSLWLWVRKRMSTAPIKDGLFPSKFTKWTTYVIHLCLLCSSVAFSLQPLRHTRHWRPRVPRSPFLLLLMLLPMRFYHLLS